jgi:hypothetical protein
LVLVVGDAVPVRVSDFDTGATVTGELVGVCDTGLVVGALVGVVVTGVLVGAVVIGARVGDRVGA